MWLVPMGVDKDLQLLVATSNEILVHNLFTQKTHLLLSSGVTIEDFDYNYHLMVSEFSVLKKSEVVSMLLRT